MPHSKPSLSAQIAPHLPYLRRYARALTGSQERGDGYVVAALEALVAEPALFDRSLDARVAVFRLLSGVWNAVQVVETTASGLASGAEHAVSLESQVYERNLDAILPLPRQAFLLTAVEGFSPAEGAAILGVDGSEFADLVDEAAREIASQVATDVLIIEDEPIIAMDIEALIQDLGHRVIDIAPTRRDAVAAAARQAPGLILADIQLADGSSGIDAVNDLIKDFDVPVVFITAYPERLLTGERPEPTFLITKPFQAETVKAIVSQALFFGMTAGRTARGDAGPSPIASSATQR